MTDPIRLREEWRDEVCSRAFEPTMNLTENGRVLGHGTILAKRCGSRQGHPALVLDGAGERIIALLSVAYGEPVAPDVLAGLKRASQAWQDGETCLALIHLARAGLPPLPDREAGYRLFAADKLLASGIAPCDLLKACGLDNGSLDMTKTGFNPDEPRVPAGNPDGGEWTDGEQPAGEAGSGSSRTPHEQPAGAGSAGNPGRRTALHGYATVYDTNLKGTKTATGDVYDPVKRTAAVLPGTIPLKSTVTVTLASDPRRSVDVYVNDHGLYRLVTNSDGSQSRVPLPGRVIDLSTAAFRALTGMDKGKIMVTVQIKIGSSPMIDAKLSLRWAALTLLIGAREALPAQAAEAFPRYCLTIAVNLRPALREEVSGLDLSVENGTVVAIPRFPPGWQLSVENRVEVSPTRISGGATGGVAELGAKDLKCLFEVQNSVPGAPPVKVTGSVYISTGEHERRVFLHGDQIVLERIRSPNAR